MLHQGCPCFQLCDSLSASDCAWKLSLLKILEPFLMKGTFAKQEKCVQYDRTAQKAAMPKFQCGILHMNDRMILSHQPALPKHPSLPQSMPQPV